MTDDPPGAVFVQRFYGSPSPNATTVAGTSAAPAPAAEPTITVSGPTACGKSFVMELIYKALRDAGLHPYSYELAHERRMVQEQPPPSAKVWHLREAVAAPQPAQADEAREIINIAMAVIGYLHPQGCDEYVMRQEARIRAYLARTGGAPNRAPGAQE